MYQDERWNRIVGTLLGCAVGDALGAPYEFLPPLEPHHEVEMGGGGSLQWERGEWTDDTSMAIAIAEVAAMGADLRDDAALDRLVERWHGWSYDCKDIGVQTSYVLAGATTAYAARKRAREFYELNKGCGNGSLMRTAPVALAYLHDEAAMAQAACAVSELTHCAADAQEACVLWCAAIRHAINTGEFDARAGFDHIWPQSRDVWEARLRDAETSQPKDFRNNGWVVTALQGAWSAISTTPREGTNEDRFRSALESAVRAGYDTDTVAAITGSLLGAAYGVSAIPAEWLRVLHGWPNLDTWGLLHLTERIMM